MFSLRTGCLQSNTASHDLNCVPLEHLLTFLYHIVIWPQEKAWNLLDTNVHLILQNHRFFRATQQLLQAKHQKIHDLDVSLITTVHL